MEKELILAADEAAALVGDISMHHRRLKEGYKPTKEQIETLRYRAAQILAILGANSGFTVVTQSTGAPASRIFSMRCARHNARGNSPAARSWATLV